MQLVLRAATAAGRTIYYDQIQVEERDHETEWNAKTSLRYEHDLVPFKSQADVIVLGFTDIVGVGRIRVNSAVWFETELLSVPPRQKALFGWEPRVQSPREAETGIFPDQPGRLPAERSAAHRVQQPFLQWLPARDAQTC